MKLSIEKKQQLLHSCEAVYAAFKALEFSRKISLETLCADALLAAENDITISIPIKNKQCDVQIIKRDGVCTAKFINLDDDFLVENHLEFLRNQEFSLVLDEKTKKYVTACKITMQNHEEFYIGGKGKKDLYPEHLDRLAKIQDHIAKNDDESMLFALATGSGKTFVQALWLLVLQHAGMSGVFGVPDQLVDQFRKDVKDILPDALANRIVSIKKKETDEHALDVLKNLATQPGIVVGSYEELLDKNFHTLFSYPEGQVAMTFDEQHLVMRVEKRKKQLHSLAEKQLNMFLTATPDEKTYELCHGKPVDTMSNKAKADAGQGKFPKMKSVKATNLDDKKQQAESDLGLFDKINMGMADSFQPQLSSPIITAFEKFQYDTEEYFIEKPQTNDYHELRWSYQPPTSRKMLCLVDDNEELINLHNFIKNSDELGDQKKFRIRFAESAVEAQQIAMSGDAVFFKEGSIWQGIVRLPFAMECESVGELNRDTKIALSNYLRWKKPADEQKILDLLASPKFRSRIMPVYKNGNIHPRDIIYKFLSVEKNCDEQIGEDYRNFKESKKTGVESIDAMPKVPLAVQLDRNIFSGMVDFILEDLTGLTVIEMNERRKNDFPAFFKLADELLTEKAMANYDIEPEYCNRLMVKGIDEAGAAKLAVVMRKIIRYYRNLGQENKNEKSHLIANWTLINEGRDAMLNDPTFYEFAAYTNKYRVLYVIKGMDEAETKIISDKPFFGFEKEVIFQKDSSGLLASNAKKRDRTMVEIFYPHSVEHHYTPFYDEGEYAITETQADTYFKLGFTGLYVSNKKTEGFSDLNLHTVVSTIPQSVNSNNDPAKSIQGLGRLRAKDDTQLPLWIETSAREVEPHFDLKRLNQDEDYYPAYFAAKKDFNISSIKYLGEKLGKRIDEYLCNSKNSSDEINYREANDAIQLMILETFRQIYNDNHHEIEQSRKYLTRVLGYAHDYLRQRQEKLAKPHQVDSFASFVGGLLNSFYIATYYLKTGEKKSELNDLVQQRKYANNQFVHLYHHILTQSDIKLLTEKSTLFGELFLLMGTKKDYAEREIKSAILSAMTEDQKYGFNRNINKNFLPLLVKYINPAKQDICLLEAEQLNNWHEIFILNQPLLSGFASASDVEKANIAIQLFRKVPRLHHYLSEKDAFTGHVALMQDLPVKMKQAVVASSAMEMNRLFGEKLAPVFVKFFAPEVQNDMLQRLQGFDHWSEVASQIDPAYLRALQDASNDLVRLSLMEPICFEILQRTELFNENDLQDHQRNYSEAISNAAAVIASKIEIKAQADVISKARQQLQGTKNLLKNFLGKGKKANDPVEPDTQLASYFADEFLKDAEPLFIDKDLASLSNFLSSKVRANAFAKYFIGNMAGLSQEEKQKPDVLIKMLKSFSRTYEKGKYHAEMNVIEFAPVKLQASNEEIGEIQVKHLQKYLRSSGIDEFKHFMLPADFKLMKKILMQDDNSRRLAEALLAAAGNLDKSSLADILSNVCRKDELYPQINKDKGRIMFADDFAELILPMQMQRIYKTIHGAYGTLSVPNKINILKKQLYPVITNPDFRKTILDTVGHFDEAQLVTLATVLGEKQKLGSEVYYFAKCLKEEKYDELFYLYIGNVVVNLMDDFFNPSNVNKPNTDLGEILFGQIMNMINLMQQEQILCHKHFNGVSAVNDKSRLAVANLLTVEVATCKMAEDKVKDEFSIFQQSAMESGMYMGCRISEERTKRYASILGTVNDNIIAPMQDILANQNKMDLLSKKQAGSREISGAGDLMDSAQKLALRIGQITPLTEKEVNEGTCYQDIIDILMQPIINNPGFSFLSDWWIQQTTPQESWIRFDAVKKIDEMMSHCKVTSNDSLRELDGLIKGYLSSNLHYVFSRQYDDVKTLERSVYALMIINNNAGEENQQNRNEYATLIADIRSYMQSVKSNKAKFFSTNMREVEKILNDYNLSDASKLYKIQFIAKDFKASSLHNAYRSVSHFFRKDRNEEGVQVDKFFDMLGNADFSGSADSATFTPWLKEMLAPQNQGQGAPVDAAVNPVKMEI